MEIEKFDEDIESGFFTIEITDSDFKDINLVEELTKHGIKDISISYEYGLCCCANCVGINFNGNLKEVIEIIKSLKPEYNVRVFECPVYSIYCEEV